MTNLDEIRIFISGDDDKNVRRLKAVATEDLRFKLALPNGSGVYFDNSNYYCEVDSDGACFSLFPSEVLDHPFLDVKQLSLSELLQHFRNHILTNFSIDISGGYILSYRFNLSFISKIELPQIEKLLDFKIKSWSIKDSLSFNGLEISLKETPKNNNSLFNLSVEGIPENELMFFDNFADEVDIRWENEMLLEAVLNVFEIAIIFGL